MMKELAVTQELESVKRVQEEYLQLETKTSLSSQRPVSIAVQQISLKYISFHKWNPSYGLQNVLCMPTDPVAFYC